MKLSLTWTDFKAHCLVLKGLTFQWLDVTAHYLVFCSDGVMDFDCLVAKTTPKNADQIDFEDNYQAIGNQTVIHTSIIAQWLGSSAPTVGQKTMTASIPVAIASDQSAIPVTIAPATAIPGIVDGYAITSVTTEVVVRATPYIEQTSDAQRSIASANAADTAAGTGARAVRLTYYTAAFAGPYTEDITLNGTSYVNTVATNICYIEDLEVLTVGTGGVNAGTLTLKAATGGGGATIGTMVAGENKTNWCHHYIPSGKTCRITSLWIGHNGTVVGSGALFTIRHKLLSIANSALRDVPGSVRLYGQSSTVQRNFGTPVKIIGPARVEVYVKPEASSTITFRAAVDFYEEAA